MGTVIPCPGGSESLTSHYIFLLGMYRLFYLFNWVYRYATEPNYMQPIVWVSGKHEGSGPTSDLYPSQSRGACKIRQALCRQPSTWTSSTLTSAPNASALMLQSSCLRELST